MKKIKFPDDFWHFDNPDASDKEIEKAVNELKKQMKGETYKSNPWFYIAAGSYIVIGLISEDGQKSIYVAKQHYSIDYIPGEGWLRESERDLDE